MSCSPYHHLFFTGFLVSFRVKLKLRAQALHDLGKSIKIILSPHHWQHRHISLLTITSMCQASPTSRPARSLPYAWIMHPQLLACLTPCFMLMGSCSMTTQFKVATYIPLIILCYITVYFFPRDYHNLYAYLKCIYLFSVFSPYCSITSMS